MSRIHNPPQQKERRQSLRAVMTPAEIALWKQLQAGKLRGRKFRRQHGIGRYIVDFYCVAERLVVELDGAAHDSEAAWRYDASRTAYLEALGLRLLRFENRDVLGNMEGVLAEIRGHFKG